jgi:hypothetical protein
MHLLSHCCKTLLVHEPSTALQKPGNCNGGSVAVSTDAAAILAAVLVDATGQCHGAAALSRCIFTTEWFHGIVRQENGNCYR